MIPRFEERTVPECRQIENNELQIKWRSSTILRLHSYCLADVKRLFNSRFAYKSCFSKALTSRGVYRQNPRSLKCVPVILSALHKLLNLKGALALRKNNYREKLTVWSWSLVLSSGLELSSCLTSLLILTCRWNQRTLKPIREWKQQSWPIYKTWASIKEITMTRQAL